MFTKRRIIQFIVIAVLFLSAMFWIYHQLSVSYREYADERNFNEINLFARTYDESFTANELQRWTASVSGMIPGARSAYLTYNEETFDFEPTTGSDAVISLYQANKETPEFISALDSCYYLEPMVMSTLHMALTKVKGRLKISSAWGRGSPFSSF